MTAAGVDLLLAAIADVRGDLKRLEMVVDMVLQEARKTNGRVSSLEADRLVREAVAESRADAAVQTKSRRRRAVEMLATLATGAALTVLAYLLSLTQGG